MSVNRNYYVIAGYDLTGLDTDKFNEWKWTEDGKSILAIRQRKKFSYSMTP